MQGGIYDVTDKETNCTRKIENYAITFGYIIFYIKNAILKINELLVFYKKFLHF